MSSTRGTVSHVTGLYENWICNVECCSSTVFCQYGLLYDKMVRDDEFEAERLHQEHITATGECSFVRLLHKSCTKDSPAASVHVFKHVATVTACCLTASFKMDGIAP